MSRNIGCQLHAPNSRIIEAPGVPGVHCLTRQSLIARPPRCPNVQKRASLSARAPVANSRFFPVTDDGPRFGPSQQAHLQA